MSFISTDTLRLSVDMLPGTLRNEMWRVSWGILFLPTTESEAKLGLEQVYTTLKLRSVGYAWRVEQSGY